MSAYKGSALRNQMSAEECAREREIWRLYMRELHLQAGGGFDDEDDDGRGDEHHPDSGWVEVFNAGQRGGEKP